MSLHCDRLYVSEIVTVTDVQYRPHDTCTGAEETTSTNDIVFPRSGCFVRHAHRRQTVADANTVLFFRKHEPYCIATLYPAATTVPASLSLPTCWPTRLGRSILRWRITRTIHFALHGRSLQLIRL